MATYYVELLAFARGQVRPVSIPDDTASLKDKLELIFHWGQNDNRMSSYYSVSVGDVAHVDGKAYLCLPTGWRLLRESTLEAYRKLVTTPGFMFSPEVQKKVLAMRP